MLAVREISANFAPSSDTSSDRLGGVVTVVCPVEVAEAVARVAASASVCDGPRHSYRVALNQEKIDTNKACNARIAKRVMASVVLLAVAPAAAVLAAFAVR